jgi:hypothetical protein
VVQASGVGCTVSVEWGGLGRDDGEAGLEMGGRGGLGACHDSDSEMVSTFRVGQEVEPSQPSPSVDCLQGSGDAGRGAGGECTRGSGGSALSEPGVGGRGWKGKGGSGGGGGARGRGKGQSTGKGRDGGRSVVDLWNESARPGGAGAARAAATAATASQREQQRVIEQAQVSALVLLQRLELRMFEAVRY